MRQLPGCSWNIRWDPENSTSIRNRLWWNIASKQDELTPSLSIPSHLRMSLKRYNTPKPKNNIYEIFKCCAYLYRDSSQCEPDTGLNPHTVNHLFVYYLWCVFLRCCAGHVLNCIATSSKWVSIGICLDQIKCIQCLVVHWVNNFQKRFHQCIFLREWYVE